MTEYGQSAPSLTRTCSQQEKGRLFCSRNDAVFKHHFCSDTDPVEMNTSAFTPCDIWPSLPQFLVFLFHVRFGPFWELPPPFAFMNFQHVNPGLGRGFWVSGVWGFGGGCGFWEGLGVGGSARSGFQGFWVYGLKGLGRLRVGGSVGQWVRGSRLRVWGVQEWHLTFWKVKSCWRERGGEEAKKAKTSKRAKTD